MERQTLVVPSVPTDLLSSLLYLYCWQLQSLLLRPPALVLLLLRQLPLAACTPLSPP